MLISNLNFIVKYTHPFLFDSETRTGNNQMKIKEIMTVESENDNEMLINETKRQLFHGLGDFSHSYLFIYIKRSGEALENEITS